MLGMEVCLEDSRCHDLSRPRGSTYRRDCEARNFPHELDVLKMASDGRTTEEIAGELSLGVETVRSHFKKAIAKLRARNRTHAVSEAMRQLLIV